MEKGNKSICKILILKKKAKLEKKCYQKLVRVDIFYKRRKETYFCSNTNLKSYYMMNNSICNSKFNNLIRLS
jgi:hypothetical protein